jgi:hypothetical protein
MFRENVRFKSLFGIPIEIDQGSVLSGVRSKSMKLPEIVAELACVYHEEAFNQNRIKY